MLRQSLKELLNFRLYQKEQIPLFRTVSGSVGNF